VTAFGSGKPTQRMPVKVDELNSDELLELGISLCRRAKWRDAIDPLQRAVALDPSKAAAHYQLGDAYNQTDRLTDALEAYESAVRLQPDHWRAMKGIGVVLDRLGRPQDATAAYQRAREAQRR
jgi:Flp pilus assembly protein TadD